MKKLVISLIVLLILFVGAAFAFPFFFKDKIIQAAKDAATEQIYATVDFKSLDVSLLQNIKDFPNITLIVENPSVAGIDEFYGDTLLTMDKLKLTLDIKSLFQTEKPMAIHSIELVNADILAKINAAGKANWDITKSDSVEEESSPFSLAIEKISLDNVNIKYIDVPGHKTANINGLDHTAKGNFTENIVQYTSETDIKSLSFFSGLVPYLKDAHLANQSTIEIDQAAKKYSFSENELKLNDLTLLLNGFVQQLDNEAVAMNLEFHTANNKFKSVLSLIPAIYQKDFSDIETKGNFDLKGTVDGLYRKNSYPKMDIAFNVTDGEFHYPGMPQRVSNININSDIKNPGGSLDNMVIEVPKFSMNIGNDPFEGRMHLRQPMSNPNLDLYAKGKINLSDVQKFYPMDGVKKLAGLVDMNIDVKAKQSDIKSQNYAAIKADGSAHIKGLEYESETVEKPLKISNLTLDFSPRFVDMPVCAGNIGSTDFNIRGRLENFIGYYLSEDEVMKGNLNLSSQKVDMNEFASDEESSSGEYVMVPDKIDFKGKADIKEMIYGKMNIKNISGGMNIHDEKIDLSDVSAELLGGKANMTAIYSTKGQTKPITVVHYEIESFDIGEVYNYMESAPKLAPIMKYMNGKLSSKSNLTMALLPDMSPDLNTLNGDFNISIPVAKISEFPVLEKIASVTKLSQFQNLEAKNINANMSFDHGKIIMKPTSFKANGLDINLKGSQGLDKSLDYKMGVDVPFSKLGNAAGIVNGLVSKFKLPFIGDIKPETVRLNMNIKGFFDNPKVGLGVPEILTGSGEPADAKTAAVDAVKQAGENVKEQAAKAVDSLKEQAVQEAKKQADKIKNEAAKRAEEAKKKAEEAIDKKKEELLNELKNKLPW